MDIKKIFKSKRKKTTNNTANLDTAYKRVLRTTVKDENNEFTDAKTIVDKLRLAFLYRDKVTGAKDRREILEEREVSNEAKSLYVTVKKFILNELYEFETNTEIPNAKYIAIQIDPKFSSIIYDVLNSHDFETYAWKPVPCNEDLLIMGAEVPRTFLFSVKYLEKE